MASWKWFMGGSVTGTVAARYVGYSAADMGYGCVVYAGAIIISSAGG